MLRAPFSDRLARHEDRLVSRLRRVVAGLIVAALVVANPATPSSAATARAPGPTLIAERTASNIFEGTTERGRAGVEASARQLVAWLGGLATAPGDLGRWVRAGDLAVAVNRCPPGDLEVSWRAPEGDYVDGAYIEPLGPEPTAITERVNGVVLCRSSTYAFVGFEASWEGGRWLLAAVPSLDEETDGPLLAGEAAATGAAPAESAVDEAGDTALPPPSEWTGTPIEPLAPYVPQSTCDPVAKPGVLGFRDLLVDAFPGTRNLGIGRACEAVGVSEHKEGRAFDWGVHADIPEEAAAADEVLAWMLGPDETGEPYAIARRLGLMYVIWDGRIWSSFLADLGWRPYVGRSGHTDHVHFSFDWNGALATSSFWQGGFGGIRPGSARPDLPLARVAPMTTVPPFLPLPLPLPVPGAPAPAPPPQPGPVAEQRPASRQEPSASEGDAPPPPTTTAPPPTTTTTSPPPSTTTTTALAPPTVPPTPTTVRLGGL